METEASSEKSDLLVRIGQGDQSAVRLFLDRYGGWIYGLAKRYTRRPEDLEDAVQEIFLHLWTNAHRFNPSLSSEMTFVTMLARRRLIDRRRREDRTPVLDQFPADVCAPAVELSTVLEHGEEVSRAREALQHLSMDQRETLQMAIFQGMTHEEIARKTNSPLGTVKTHVRRGLIRLREVLDEAATGRRVIAEGGAS
jgi:RNA polymerase sigma-70 factor (ECF subfamily)